MTARDAQLYVPPWLPKGAADVWLEAWKLDDTPGFAIDQVRKHGDYGIWFPGNVREDGSTIMSEDEYVANIESYKDSLLSIGVNPDLFDEQFPNLIQGLVDPGEFNQRVQTMYESVLVAAPAIRDYYAAEYSFDMTDSAIIASFLDPDIGQAIITRRIAISEVGGEASQRSFNVGAAFSERLVQAGLDTQGEAAQFFAEADMMIPAISVLAARHQDPDDDFDLEEFTQATIFGDPDQRRRMRRLMAQERSSFGADRSLTVTGGDRGLLTGLESR
jgi:hypothetical protein